MKSINVLKGKSHIALVNSTVQRQVIGLQDMYGSIIMMNVKLACGVVCKLTVERKQNVIPSQVAHLSFAIHYSGIRTREN